ANAGRAVGGIDIGREVGMREVQAGIDIADGYRGTPAIDRPRLGCMDLYHVPLHAGQCVIARGRRGVGIDGAGAVARVVVIQLDGDGSAGRGAFDATVRRDIERERRIVGMGNGDTDGVVAVDERAARPRDRIAGYGRLLVEDEI